MLFSDSPAAADPGEVMVFPARFLPDFLDPPTAARREILIAYGSVSHMPAAFACGCADYLADPWLPEELFFRALRARSGNGIDFSGGRIDIVPFALVTERKNLPLSFQEHLLLLYLVRHAGTPVPRDALLHELGLLRTDYASRAVDVHVSSLRKKLRLCGMGAGGGNPIRSVRGVGYALSGDL